jgi:hypothetical protein
VSAILSSGEYYIPLSLTFSATSLNFAPLQTGLTSASQTVTVTNASAHTVTFSSITSIGEYLENNNCPTTMNPGQNCTITLNFAPTTAGTQNGSVTLSDDTPGSPKQIIKLTGIGESNAVSFVPATLTFPGTTPGTSSAPMTTSLYNDGAATVSISSIGITPPGATFTETNSCPATLSSGQSCTVSVVFTPPDSGNYSTMLSVSDNATGSPQTAALSGVGLNN